MPDFEDAVIAAVRAIPVGSWSTYGEIAADAGRPGAARAVGNILRTTAEELPWWRVVGAGGRISAPDPSEQASRLRAEGLTVRDRRII
jgi:alkylated DNA nucleotide flippase Atl1